MATQQPPRSEKISPPLLPWRDASELIREKWAPGMHFSIMSGTGDGKTYLALALLELRDHVLIMDGKGVDPELDSSGYKTITEFPNFWRLLGTERWKFRLRPPLGRARAILDDAFRRVWRSAGGWQERALEVAGRERPTWTIYADETRLLAAGKFFKLEDHLIALWIAGRSRGISLLASVQAPRFIPSEFYDQPGWMALGRPRDDRTLKRTAEVSGHADVALEVLPKLKPHHFLFVGPGETLFISKPVRSGRGARSGG